MRDGGPHDSCLGFDYAFISYCVFVRDSKKDITGARSVKQIVLINGLPF